MAKTVPVTKFTELRGLDRISVITHEMKCLFRVISQDDVGIDVTGTVAFRLILKQGRYFVTFPKQSSTHNGNVSGD